MADIRAYDGELFDLAFADKRDENGRNRFFVRKERAVDLGDQHELSCRR